MFLKLKKYFRLGYASQDFSILNQNLGSLGSNLDKTLTWIYGPSKFDHDKALTQPAFFTTYWHTLPALLKLNMKPWKWHQKEGGSDFGNHHFDRVHVDFVRVQCRDQQVYCIQALCHLGLLDQHRDAQFSVLGWISWSKMLDPGDQENIS